MKSNTLNKVTICSNKKFRNLIIEAANIKDEKTIAVAYWETPALYYDIKERYPEKDVYYIEVENNNNLYGFIENAIYVKSEEDFLTMHFDKVIMNPAYLKGLHLKIILNILKNNCANTVINLSPINQLIDESMKYKSTTGLCISYNEIEYIKRHIKNIEIISDIDMSKAFNTAQGTQCAITELTADEQNFDFSYFSSDFKLVDKILSQKDKYSKILSVLMTGDFKDGKYYFKIPHVFSNIYHKGDAIYYVSPNKETTYSIDTNVSSGFRIRWIEFNSEIERENFYNYVFNNLVFKYLVLKTKFSQNMSKFLPFMGDYTQPWTNQRFCEYFGITGFISDTEAEPDSEWGEILNTMKDYM